MLIEITPSRILNDGRGVFGLWMTDLAGAIFLFVLLSSLLDGTAFAILSAPIALGSLVPLIPIRLSTRRKIIRDFLIYWATPRTLFEVRNHVFRTRA